MSSFQSVAPCNKEVISSTRFFFCEVGPAFTNTCCIGLAQLSFSLHLAIWFSRTGWVVFRTESWRQEYLPCALDVEQPASMWERESTFPFHRVCILQTPSTPTVFLVLGWQRSLWSSLKWKQWTLELSYWSGFSMSISEDCIHPSPSTCLEVQGKWSVPSFLPLVFWIQLPKLVGGVLF